MLSRSMILALAASAALLLVAMPATAGPDCTCDPNPATRLLHCLIDGTQCPEAPGVPGWVPDPNGLVDDLTHPEMPPCTCDPHPLPITVVLP